MKSLPVSTARYSTYQLSSQPLPIVWCQERIGKEYVVDGKLCGKDVDSSRAPQHYGFHDLDSFMKVNGYDVAADSFVKPNRYAKA